MIYLYGFTFLGLLVSIIMNKKKTIKALGVSWKKFYNIFPAFLLMFIFISIVIYFVSDEIIIKYSGGGNVISGMAIASNWMSAASFLGMAALMYGTGYHGLAYVVGWTGGYVLLLILMA